MTGNCGNCGSELKYQARFCGRCGARVEVDAAPKKAQASQPEPERPSPSENRSSINPKRKRQTVAIPLEQLINQPIPPPAAMPTSEPDSTPERKLASEPAEAPPETFSLTEPLFPDFESLRGGTEEVPVVKSEFPIPPPIQQNVQEKKIEKPQMKVRVSGAWTVPNVAQPVASSAASSSNRKWIALVVPVVLLAAACGLFFVFNSRRSAAEPSDVNQVQMVSSPTPDTASKPVSSSVTVPETANRPTPLPRKATPTQTPFIAPAKPTPAPKVPELATKSADPPTPVVQREPQPAPTPVLKSPAGGLTANDHLKQGVANLNAGRFQEALSDFEKARRQAPGNPDLYYLIGQAYHRLGKLDQALVAYRQCTSGVYASVAQNNVRMLERRASPAK